MFVHPDFKGKWFGFFSPSFILFFFDFRSSGFKEQEVRILLFFGSSSFIFIFPPIFVHQDFKGKRFGFFFLLSFFPRFSVFRILKGKSLEFFLAFISYFFPDFRSGF